MQTHLVNATPAQLEQAAAFNHRELFIYNAQALGGTVQEDNGLTYTFGGPEQEGMVAFPVLDVNKAGEQLDAMMHWYRQHIPGGIGCWSLSPTQPADLGIRLLARGFQPGWLPGWMGLDLQRMQTGFPIPEGLQVHADNETIIKHTKDLPYAGDNGAVALELLQRYPERAQRFVAMLNGEVVAHSCVFLSIGPYGAAGIYNVGVVPKVRQRGIGKAVVIAACQHALKQGYHYVVLNGTGRRMYQQIGFQWLGNGFTWWLNKERLRTPPPTAQQIALAEAVGRGDIPALSALSSPDLQITLTNGMTLMQLAIHCRQPQAAAWLLEQGAPCSVLDAWDLGWKDRAANLLTAQPALANQRQGQWGATILHMAAERNDMALAQLALSANPDLSITDTTYDSTALGWAKHLKRPQIIALIEAHERKG